MLIPVILSGGAGARLWPVSREAYPKPFIRLPDGKTLLRKTFERATALPDAEAITVVTNQDYYFLTKDQYDAGVHEGIPATFLLEPCARNTAPAVAIAAVHAAARYGPRAELLILPADHIVENDDEFRSAVAAARLVAATGRLVTFGIEPTRPETGFGYIEYGEPLPVSESTFAVRRFVEKPTAETAAQFLAEHGWLWNSGMFCFTAGDFLAALQKCAPDIYRVAQQCMAEKSERSSATVTFPTGQFAEFPDISIDHAVMEKHDSVGVVKAGFQWNDVGSWTAWAEIVPADHDGNRIVGEAAVAGSRDCYIQSEGRLIAAVGVEKLVVIDTADALLIAHRDRVNEVKHVVSRLKLAKHESYLVHRTAHRPWGTYTVLEDRPNYKIKRIEVQPGASLSLQLHRHRSEHWVVLSGTATVVNDGHTYEVSANQSTFISAGQKHRLSNRRADALVIIEVQTGSYVGEDDIERFDDVYDRH